MDCAAANKKLMNAYLLVFEEIRRHLFFDCKTFSLEIVLWLEHYTLQRRALHFDLAAKSPNDDRM
jgi:hypothetical protein